MKEDGSFNEETNRGTKELVIERKTSSAGIQRSLATTRRQRP